MEYTQIIIDSNLVFDFANLFKLDFHKRMLNKILNMLLIDLYFN